MTTNKGIADFENKIRTGVDALTISRAFLDHLFYMQGCTLMNASMNDLYMALSYTVRDRMLTSWNKEVKEIIQASTSENYKIVSYLSAEFLPGPHLANNLVCLGIMEEARKAMKNLAIDIDDILGQEEEPGLGNGGLGRLASCFMDSLATLNIPAFGYGIRYEFGIFDQEIDNGWQIEMTDKWLKFGNPWEMPKPEFSQQVFLGGYTESYADAEGKYCVKWNPNRVVKGVPYDTPIIGFGNKHFNTLRLWKAEAIESFDFNDFNIGDYYAAVDEKVSSETITKVLYPNDETDAGKQLRLIQQYFFVSCSLKDMIRQHFFINNELENFHKHYTIQLNDTHPSIAVAEFMRLLLDDYHKSWDEAWNITIKTFAYTNHTLLPEALEKWRIDIFSNLLPRHLEIIFEINSRFLVEVDKKFPNDGQRKTRMSIIDETGPRYIRMANLACIGSKKINGVAELHSELLKNHVLTDFYELWPDKFKNVTNGVTPRRWVAVSNQNLTRLISKKIGKDWVQNFSTEINKLEKYAKNKDFQTAWQKVKLDNKKILAKWIKKNTGIKVNTEALFDIQVKRIHEYKRQHLNVLHIISLYSKLKENPNLKIPPRVFLFGGKAAPGYFIAKRIIKLINSVGQVVNNDREINDMLKVVYLPNFNVQTGHITYPAADLSEQISLAGKEASGTGNMKFTMNGALTIGTLDGANVEIREEVGEENFFLFGLKVEEVLAQKKYGYKPWEYYESNQDLKKAINQISSGFYSGGDTEIFKPLVDNLLRWDDYMVLADFESYVKCQEKVSKAYLDQENWTRMAILNVARSGKFSSDRSIADYAEKIWEI
ncbi:MAG: glycogen/starch/alpha-glucan phosphorylase [Bacteroidales bacterium]|nr:glycogen/starch/alpha-glucan phosphorylase [Bacteroidales bacterium]MBN2817400.1 glycogen/starch/alpha-glucan phosphorylase [Bacteroidales bacterium]